jgi:hypothetical protein
MVMLLTRRIDSTDTKRREIITAQDRGAESGNAGMDQTFRAVFGESHSARQDNSGTRSRKASDNASFITRVTHPLLVLYNLVAGSPMTRRDRHRWAMGEANIRNYASLSWFNRTPW